jgi:hypothetical protein
MLIQPTRKARQLENGDWLIKVTPPEWSGFHESASIVLNPDQFHRFKGWLQSGALIQDALPDLSPSQREVLMTGIDDYEWDREFGDDDGED